MLHTQILLLIFFQILFLTIFISNFCINGSIVSNKSFTLFSVNNHNNDKYIIKTLDFSIPVVISDKYNGVYWNDG